jgi:hypothetical protein
MASPQIIQRVSASTDTDVIKEDFTKEMEEMRKENAHLKVALFYPLPLYAI